MGPQQVDIGYMSMQQSTSGRNSFIDSRNRRSGSMAPALSHHSAVKDRTHSEMRLYPTSDADLHKNHMTPNAPPAKLAFINNNGM